MAVTDPIADLLTRIRNGQQAKHAVVHMPGSKIKRPILERLQEEGFVEAVQWEDDDRQGVLSVRLKYDRNGEPAIDGLKRISSPGRRSYVHAGDIPQARSGYGTVILSTSRGVVTDRTARELGVGGEVLCSVW